MARGQVREWFARALEEANLRQQSRIRELEAHVARLQRDNERIRTAMRRCVTCEYRTESLARRGEDSCSPR